jgi:hypothetical protein
MMSALVERNREVPRPGGRRFYGADQTATTLGHSTMSRRIMAVFEEEEEMAV